MGRCGDDWLWGISRNRSLESNRSIPRWVGWGGVGWGGGPAWRVASPTRTHEPDPQCHTHLSTHPLCRRLQCDWLCRQAALPALLTGPQYSQARQAAATSAAVDTTVDGTPCGRSGRGSTKSGPAAKVVVSSAGRTDAGVSGYGMVGLGCRTAWDCVRHVLLCPPPNPIAPPLIHQHRCTSLPRCFKPRRAHPPTAHLLLRLARAVARRHRSHHRRRRAVARQPTSAGDSRRAAPVPRHIQRLLAPLRLPLPTAARWRLYES